MPAQLACPSPVPGQALAAPAAPPGRQPRLPAIGELAAWLGGRGVAARERLFDPAAVVLDRGVNSEAEQRSLARAAIAAADRFAIITSYAVRPISREGQISSTMRAILEGIAARQGDPGFTLCFFYNKDTWLQALAVGKRTDASHRDKPLPSPWVRLVEAYNAEERGKPDGRPIQDLRCHVFLIGATAHGLAGAHHNKFLVNDRGFVATLGASLGNRTKRNWFDSGATALSRRLAAAQRDYFLGVLLPRAASISELAVDATGQPSLLRRRLPSVRAALDAPVVDPRTNAGACAALRAALDENRLGCEGREAEVLWLQNKGSTMTLSATSKAIGKAIKWIFARAEPGQALCLRNCAIDAAVHAWLLAALARGVDVKILGPVNKSDSQYYRDLGRLLAAADRQQGPGRLEFRVFDPHPSVWGRYGYDPGDDGVVDHGKVYVVRDGARAIVMTGTHNLDSQSFKRSNENLMVEQGNDALATSLFDDLWGASPELNRAEVDALVAAARRYHQIEAHAFGENPDHYGPALSPVLAKKVGVHDLRAARGPGRSRSS